MGLYFLAILPPSGLEEQLKQIKMEMKQRFGTGHALKLHGHITLLPPFEMKEEQEPALERTIASVCAKVAPFEIQLNGFGSFPPRVIFVRIAEHGDLQPLQNRLALAVEGEVPAAGKREKEMHPHITIASRDLKKEDFREAWKQFRDREYQALFMAEKVVLFRHQGKCWGVFKEFGFDGKFTS